MVSFPSFHRPPPWDSHVRLVGPAGHRSARCAPRLQREARTGRRPRRGRPRRRARRVLRPARTQRRGQDHAHQDPDDAPAAVRGDGEDLRVRRRHGRQADPADHEHGRGRRAVRLRHPHRPRAALDVQPVLRSPPQGRLAPRRRAHRSDRLQRPGAAARQHALDRPAPEDELRARPPQRPVDPLPRRADARARCGGGTLRPRARDGLEGGRAWPDGPADDPLHGGG